MSEPNLMYKTCQNCGGKEVYEVWPPVSTATQYRCGWIPVSERMPEDGVECLVCVPASKYEEAYRTFDMLEEGVWQAHYANYEHFEAIGGSNAIPGEVSTGPQEEAPYTHWMPLPLPPEEGK